MLAPGDLAQTMTQVAASACGKHFAGLWDKESGYKWRRRGFRSKHVQLSYCRAMCCVAPQTINICLSKDTQQIVLPCVCRATTRTSESIVRNRSHHCTCNLPAAHEDGFCSQMLISAGSGMFAHYFTFWGYVPPIRFTQLSYAGLHHDEGCPAFIMRSRHQCSG